ncbi:MAG TPA: RIP metalloprotease RseP [Candidatus Blautia intestinigallinarum]|nr:RIP metalloprotease RseP [Candidatus Blautia intestinigallinarum]
MRIVIAVIIFSAIILFHELGHFLLAKKNHVVVTEFSLGMGPRLLSTVKGGTRYSLKLLPLGGSCMMLGEDEDGDGPGSFNAASPWARIAIVAAGPIFNFIMAFLLAVIIVGCVGYVPAEVMQVEKGSPAEEAGLEEGDIIKKFDGYQVDIGNDIYTYTTLYELQQKPITIEFERDGEEHSLTYTPDVLTRYLLGFNRVDTDSMEVGSLIKGMPLEDSGIQAGDVITAINGVAIPDGEAYNQYIEENPLGDQPVVLTYERNGKSYETTVTPKQYDTVLMGFSYNLGCVKTGGLNVIKYAALEVKYWIRTTVHSVEMLVKGHFGIQDLTGPVGVVDVIGDTYEEAQDQGTLMVWMNMLNLAILLSANLGVMNLLPLPALDGGRLVFLILEVIFRRPVNRQVEGMIHFAGLMLLMLLMIVVMYNDVMRIL